MFFLFLTLIACLNTCATQIIQDKQCDSNIQLQENFVTTRFLGKWYITRRASNQLANGDCSHFDFVDNNGTISVYNRAVNSNFLEEVSGEVTQENNTAKLRLSINTGTSTRAVDFWILSSEYEFYALAYACENINSTHRRVSIWQILRETHYETTYENMMVLMNVTLNERVGVSLSDLTSVDHSALACNVLPDIPEGQPIVLHGVCNSNTTVVQNLSLVNFTGVWHQIAAYYSPTEPVGSCPRSELALAGAGLSVSNTRVRNQTLETINGSVTFHSSDGSALLTVTLDTSPGIFNTSTLWILATDYNEYAIGYTCQDIADDKRLVNSWIFGRSRQLSPAGEAAVGLIISTNYDLSWNYYKPSNQSDEDCFFYPEPIPGKPVVFRGQCDQSIAAKPAFDVQKYMGTWHAIESYPSINANGSCNNAQYTNINGTIEVLNRQVFNQSLDIVNGIGSVASSDGSGKMIISFRLPDSNVTVDMEYWVLETDYDSYALVYSCNNIDDGRLVESWKLSRAKQLDSTAETAIAQAMSSVAVLEQRYFEENDQSEEGCFYFPEPQPGLPVIFPGKCENDLPIITDFNITRFNGVWFEVESYPMADRSGQCVEHAFSLSDGSLSMETSSVHDQLLYVSNGSVFYNSTDGSGKLSVSITSSNSSIEMSFWMLAVDYDDFALAYSCYQVEEDRRAIHSWKLSRNRGLSAAATNAINAVISNVNVLERDYFVPVDYSNRACFFLPDLSPGEPFIIPGQCDTNIQPMPNFDIEAYQGRWRIVESYGTDSQNGDCGDVTYEIGNANETLTQKHSRVINETLDSYIGYVNISDWNNSSKLVVSFPGEANPFEYFILDTDYKSYSLGYSCSNLNNITRRIWSWKLSRTRGLDQSAIEKIHRVVDNIDVLNNRYYESTNQTDAGCFYYPEHVPNKPVVFRAQCDNRIHTVAEFDAFAFSGVWHEVASYPNLASFEDGTCNNARFTLSNGSVEVSSSRVINRTLTTVVGVAEYAVNQSAILNITWDSINNATSLWVLATDYDDYALVYSCANIDDEYITVWSSKLSRRKNISDTAQGKIDEVLSVVPVLRDAYYDQRDQTDEGCFYYPEPQEGVPVVFPGQCDESIRTVSNFNTSMFLGVWHQVQAYPSGQNLGECVSHEFHVLNNSNIGVLSQSVLQRDLMQTEGYLTYNSTANDGKLTFVTRINNQDVEIPFWILSTDYTNYTVAYGCVNVNDTNRAVYSWKLSRTKQLSPVSNDAIDIAIADIAVLESMYYEHTNQSDEQCFYLPELVPGKPMVFVGQCDDSIPVQQNFDPIRYQGRWRVIESYPSEFLSGTCNDAEYTVRTGGALDVYNTQVVNQTLDTINGTAVPATTDNRGKLNVTFPGFAEPSPYWILQTDYTNYSLVYSCRNISDDQRMIISWKLSRTRSLSTTAESAINHVVAEVDVLEDRYYQRVDHSHDGCFYYPPPDGRPVVFRSNCNMSLPVVSNFSVSRFTGVWLEVASYPNLASFEGGTCNNALVTLGNGSVEVFSSRVINRTLTTVVGVADYTVNQSAILNITWDSINNATSLWVLATDYDDYALVYSCANIDDEYITVWSSKLSRRKNISDTALGKIDEVLSVVPVLRDAYYDQRDQTDEGCFYYPEPQEEVPVVFPGQCDESIRTVSNFNTSMFLGVWHQIQAYPIGQNLGECVSHEFQVLNNSNIGVLSQSVLQRDLMQTEGYLTYNSTANDGKLTFVTRINNQDVEIPFWILSTDYTNYTVAYGCINVNDTNRAVYSWKLSRTKQLSPVSNDAIDFAIADIAVLESMYYEHTNQSDEQCFYLPELVPGKPMVFVGQCDDSIPVQQNFDPIRYQGRWRVIESYPSEFLSGTCNDAEYTVRTGGALDVYNTQVVNQTLDTINGTTVPATTDNSGKLNVTFPGFAEPTPYWILQTDYTNYSLVYSCRNISDDQRMVISWKLSRTQSLSTTAESAINRVVDEVDVLEDRYYQRVDHSHDGCFYYPPPDGKPVVFRSQCNESLPVVSNFSVSKFTGVWHEVASYPNLASFEGGTCNNALVTLGNGSVEVSSSRVINRTLTTVVGVAEYAVNQSAILNITWDSINNATSLWVLATDYDDYALVYSCANIDDEYITVWSSKLSRRKNISDTAQGKIDEVLSVVPVLRDAYYDQRDQTDEGCFYYPKPQEGVPVVFPGQCDESIRTVSNFNTSMFLGVWHQIQAYPIGQNLGECVSHEFQVLNNSNIGVLSQSVLQRDLMQTEGYLTYNSTANDGKLTFVTRINNQDVEIPFWILSTDYTNYTVAYGCVNVNDTNRAVYSWKLSRTKQLSPVSNDAIDFAIADIAVLESMYYEHTNQSDEQCFYLPELVPGKPMVFVGQCDDSIPVQQNFDPIRYQGRWRVIESYPSEFLSGTCNDAQYTVRTGGALDVYNTQVVNQTLDTINGTAVPATTDNSGKLNVTFPGFSDPSPYWILQTDYTNYSLVYSCRNINDEQRLVISWKLSRTQSLSTTAESAINRVVAEVDVLEDRYYQRVDHGHDGCFYYPPPDGRPVVFRSQCNESLPVVSNFSVSKYMGEWYDVESYPVVFQDGTCPKAIYKLTADVVNVTNTQVVDQELQTIDGVAVFDGTASSAKLTVSFPILGTNQTTAAPYWVLATDYDNYALVYSCVNLDDEYSTVSSWKLSRQQNLSDSSLRAIEDAASDVPVLRRDYYLERAHGEDDCLFYPDNEGGPVKLGGQCDFENIDYVSDFNVDSFRGVWYEAERYPSELQTGECVANDYVPASPRSFTITKTIVNDERLTVVSGQATVVNGSGILDVALTNENGVSLNTRLYVMAVDYNDYALLFGCNELNTEEKQIYSWKLSRSQRELSPPAISMIDTIVNETRDLSPRYYEQTDQDISGCFHYPDLKDNQTSIELLGHCDESVRGKPNFNVTSYLGRWYEISSFPDIDRYGDCGRKEIVEVDGQLVAVSSRVVNRNHEIESGRAELASTDGSGVLSVSYVSESGVRTVRYYVLETDYSDFALVYSCDNLENKKRKVTSWKLSRGATLSREAEEKMAPIINSTQGLLENYYLPNSQSEEACFYVPALNVSHAPLYRGRCQSFTGVQGFDAHRYIGWWHEIERYPSDVDVGHCISSNFRTYGNRYQVIETNIFDNAAQTRTSTVTVSADGRLRKTYSDGRVDDVWVLATDYETYSLLFSCENVDDEYMRVWSAKHSKARTLSSTALQAMESVISENRYLHEQFYLPVDQSDDTCFHYPEQFGDQIILPGQCDTNISVQQQFDLALYSGVWYQIEGYPHIHVNGTCIGTRYTFDESTGLVNIRNWQQLDNELDIMDSTATINSTDSSAKLIVTLPIRGTNATVSTWLYVLETNYLSYSLAYTCRNVDKHHRAIGAWKLSRHRTLLPADQATISAIVSRTRELYQPYFEPVEQNEDCKDASTALYSSIILISVCLIFNILKY